MMQTFFTKRVIAQISKYWFYQSFKSRYQCFFFFFFFFFFIMCFFFFFFFFFFYQGFFFSIFFFYLFLLSDLIAIYTSCSRFWSKIDDAVHHIHFLNNERALPQWVLYIDVIHRWNISLFCLIAIPK